MSTVSGLLRQPGDPALCGCTLLGFCCTKMAEPEQRLCMSCSRGCRAGRYDTGGETVLVHVVEEDHGLARER